MNKRNIPTSDNSCPACGGYVTENRYYCNHCGVYLKGHQPGKSPGKSEKEFQKFIIAPQGFVPFPKQPARSRKEFQRTEQKRKIPVPYRLIAVGIILVIISAFVLGNADTIRAVLPPLNISSSSADSFPGLSSSALPAASSGFDIRINYAGSWTGSYSSGGSITPVNGVGARSIPVTIPSSEISGTFSKAGQDTKPMTIQIVKNGVVAKTESTSSPNGVVRISYMGS